MQSYLHIKNQTDNSGLKFQVCHALFGVLQLCHSVNESCAPDSNLHGLCLERVY